MKAGAEARRLARLGAIADVRVQAAQRALATAEAAVQGARHRHRRIEALIADLPTHGQVGVLAASASLRAVLHRAAQAARDEYDGCQRNRDAAQRTMQAVNARASHISEQASDARRRAAAEAEAQALLDLPPPAGGKN